MAGMPAGSIIINATGMGKDIPGSLITDDGLFPKNSIVLEFNYRGELDYELFAQLDVVAMRTCK